MLMDGTAFSGNVESEYKEILKKNGFDEFGEEILYDGVSGETNQSKNLYWSCLLSKTASLGI